MQNKTYLKLLLAALLALGAFFAAGCEDNSMEDAADEVGDAMEEGAENVGDAAEEAGDAVEDATN